MLWMINCFAEFVPKRLINFCLIYFPTVSFEDSQYDVVPLTAEKVLELIEQAYPNPVTSEDLARFVIALNSNSLLNIKRQNVYLYLYIFAAIMAGPKKRCFKSCYRLKVVELSNPWSSIHSLVFIMKTLKSK